MGTFVLALTLGILARAWLSPLIKLPYTCVVLLIGTYIGGWVDAACRCEKRRMDTSEVTRSG